MDQDVLEGAARGMMFALTRAYDETLQKSNIICVPGSSVATARALDHRFSRVTSPETLCPEHIARGSTAASSDAAFRLPASAAAIVQSRQSAKVMMHFRWFAMLVAYNQDDGTESYVHIYGQMPSA